MDISLLTFLPTLRCKESTLHLAFAWILGLVSGIFFSLSADCFPLSEVRTAASLPVSLLGSLSAIALPLLFSAFAVYISQPLLLIPIAFCKAFLFSYFSLSVLVAFGSAGWLVQLLFMFNDILTLPLLWSFWQKGLTADRNGTFRFLFPVFIITLIVGYIEYRFISPFLAKILS